MALGDQLLAIAPVALVVGGPQQLRQEALLRLAPSRLRHLAEFVELDGVAVEIEQREAPGRSEEHTSELQSLMRISYAVFCLKKKTKRQSDNKLTHKKNI